MRPFLCLIIFTGLGVAYGQTHLQGYSLGANYAFVDRPQYDYYEPVLGLSIDGFYRFQKEHFLSKTSLGFQQKGFSQELIFVDTSGNILGQGAKENTRFSYIGLTQLAGLRTKGERCYVYAAAGLSLGFYLGTHVNSPDFELDDGTVSEGYSYSFNNLKPLDLAGVGEAGIGFRMKGGGSIELIGVYNHGLLKIRYKETLTPQPWYNHCYSFRIGITSPIFKGMREDAEDVDIP